MNIKKVLLSFKRKKIPRLLGIDLRPNFIRVVELSYTNSKYYLHACVNLELGEPLDSQAAMVAAIKAVVTQAVPHTTATAIALSHTGVIFQEFQVAADLSIPEIEQFLRFNLGKQVEGAAEQLNFDYQQLELVNNVRKLQAVAVRRERPIQLVTMLQAAKLHPVVIDIDIYALERAIRRQWPHLVGLSVVFNLDDDRVLIIVLDSNHVVYWHEDGMGPEKSLVTEQVLEFIELKLCLIYSVLSQPLSQLIIGGSAASLPGLLEALRQNSKLQVAVANPFWGMELALELAPQASAQLAPLMLISCGLALRVSDHEPH